MKLIDKILKRLNRKNAEDKRALDCKSEAGTSEIEPRQHYWRATIMSNKEGEPARFARWITESDTSTFPIMEVERKYYIKYKTRPVVLFWGEISKQDYEDGKRIYRSIKPGMQPLNNDHDRII